VRRRNNNVTPFVWTFNKLLDLSKAMKLPEAKRQKLKAFGLSKLFIGV
jgi:hypothetical protein